MSYCQLKYRATESDKLRRDPGYCNICKKTEGELKRCAACQEVDYCSIECQRADWKEHKSGCLQTQKQRKMVRSNDPRTAAFGGLHPMSLLSKWLDVHRWALDTTIRDSMYVEYGGPRSFDYERQCFALDLRYRDDCQGNPSLAYRVAGVRYEPIPETKEDENFTEWVKTFGDPQRRSPLFAGVLMIKICPDQHGMLFPCAIDDHPRSPFATHMWGSRFQAMVLLGHVARLPDGKTFQFGRMFRRGKYWQWEAYTMEDFENTIIPMPPP